ncbi:MAG: DUF4760 domain-containing protein [Ruminococcaceae bacterium]|nr:DUF4760 domain-containing protein [Oscillospiraceae bacterium]
MIECVSKILEFACSHCEIIASITSVLGSIVSVSVYRTTMKREKKILTIEHLSKIREEYSGGFPSEKNNIEKYLKKMEFFCVGINSGIYDIKIVKKMSGRLLLEHYEKMKIYIQKKKHESSWCEYEKVMKKLQKMYKRENKGDPK